MGVRLIVRPAETWQRRLAKAAVQQAQYRCAIADLVEAGLSKDEALRAVRTLPRFKDMPGVTPRRTEGDE